DRFTAAACPPLVHTDSPKYMGAPDVSRDQSQWMGTAMRGRIAITPAVTRRAERGWLVSRARKSIAMTVKVMITAFRELSEPRQGTKRNVALKAPSRQPSEVEALR